jgi:hypothetical protein
MYINRMLCLLPQANLIPLLTVLTMTQLKQVLAKENEASTADSPEQLTATASSFLLAIVELEDKQ